MSALAGWCIVSRFLLPSTCWCWHSSQSLLFKLSFEFQNNFNYLLNSSTTQMSHRPKAHHLICPHKPALCAIIILPLSKAKYLRNHSSSSHSQLRHLINSIYFIFVIILPFHSYYHFRDLGCPHLLSGLQHWILILSSPTQPFSTVFRLIFQIKTDHVNPLLSTLYWLPSI